MHLHPGRRSTSAVRATLAFGIATAFVLAPRAGGAQTTVTVLPRYPAAADPTFVSGVGGALSNSGQVAGWSYVGIQPRGGLTGADAAGPFRLVPIPPDRNLMYLNAASDNGRAAGYVAGGPNDLPTQAVYFDGTTSRELRPYAGASSTVAFDVNDAGRVVGWGSGGLQRGFVSAPDGGSLTALGTLGGSSSSAWGINNRGRVVGDA